MPAPDGAWLRRARPALGTLVEIGIGWRAGDASAAQHARAAVLEAGFAAIAHVQASLSRFAADSAIARYNAAAEGEVVPLEPDSRELLLLANELHAASAGCFDVSLGSGGWRLEDAGLRKLHAASHLDLGGLAKGWAVDRAVAALQEAGAFAGWVNAGGDLRGWGVELPLALRDEATGGVRHLGSLGEGAFATSCFAARNSPGRQVLAGGVRAAHVSVAAPCCAWADALTKVVGITGDPHHPLLQRYDARAWIHQQ